MKTIPEFEDMDTSPERYDELLLNWQRPEANKFGTWYDWSEGDVNYLIRELTEGNYDDDDREKGQGSNNLIACRLLHAVQVSNRQTRSPKLPEFMCNLEGAIWLMLSDLPENCIEDPFRIDQLDRVLNILYEPLPPGSIYDEFYTVGDTIH